MRPSEKMLERAQQMIINPTRHEKIMRNRLELSGISFKNQWVIGRYIVDFLIGNIVLEIDGESHQTDAGIIWDLERDLYLSERGYRVIRIPNREAATFNLSFFKTVLRPKRNKKWKNAVPRSARYKELSYSQQTYILRQLRLAGHKYKR